MNPLLPGSILGIIGTNLVTQDFIFEAIQLGYRIFHLHASDEPSLALVEEETIASYQDKPALMAFAQKVDGLFFLTNRIEVDLVYALSSKALYFQSFELAEVSQNRMVEKLFVEEGQINVAPYGLVTSVGELPGIVDSLGLPVLVEPNRPDTDEPSVLTIFDKDLDERVLALLEDQACMLTAFVPATRYFTLTIVRDYHDQVSLLPITEDTYVEGQWKYSVAARILNPEWRREMNQMAYRIMGSLSGATLASLHIRLAENGIFYLDRVTQLPLAQQNFTPRQLGLNLGQICLRLATGLPIHEFSLKQDCLLVPIYQKFMPKIPLLMLTKPDWEFRFFPKPNPKANDLVGMINLSGESTVQLLNDLDMADLFRQRKDSELD